MVKPRDPFELDYATPDTESPRSDPMRYYRELPEIARYSLGDMVGILITAAILIGLIVAWLAWSIASTPRGMWP